MSGVRLRIRALSFKVACDFVDCVHRHHNAPQGHKFSFGVVSATGTLVGVAIVGRPVARHLDDGLTLEVTRVATDGTPGACSALYAAAWRAARAAGYWRALTYTQDGESGASLRGAGWLKVADLPARPGWNSTNRPRADRGTDNIARTLWQITTHEAPPLPKVRDETWDETRPRRTPLRCAVCHTRMPAAATGRPARYCSCACRKRAYRNRKKTPQGAT